MISLLMKRCVLENHYKKRSVFSESSEDEEVSEKKEDSEEEEGKQSL